MPELPEIETVTKALRPHLVNRKILRTIATTKKLRNILDINQRDDILLREITAVRRRAKYIIVYLENLRTIILHLGMSGSCRVEASSKPVCSHDHISWYLDNNMVWRFNDPRRFGMVKVEYTENPGAFPPSLQQLPPEPLEIDFSVAYLAHVLCGRRKGIKSVLMDNRLVAGLGNIYACESLFLAGINPMMSAEKLSVRHIETLVMSIKEVLQNAIRAGGTTISDFKSVDGDEGKFFRELCVYGKEKSKCSRCKKEAIKKVKLSGRSTFFCPRCQR